MYLVKLLMKLAVFVNILTTDWKTADAGLAPVYCSQYAYCVNETSCFMSGEINEYMGLVSIKNSNNASYLTFMFADNLDSYPRCMYSEPGTGEGRSTFGQISGARSLVAGNTSWWGNGQNDWCEGLDFNNYNGTGIAENCPWDVVNNTQSDMDVEKDQAFVKEQQTIRPRFGG